MLGAVGTHPGRFHTFRSEFRVVLATGHRRVSIAIPAVSGRTKGVVHTVLAAISVIPMSTDEDDDDALGKRRL